MHNILSKLLAKRGIKDVTELDKEERIQFEVWHGILSKENLTLEDIKNFCQAQIEVIEGKWKDFNIKQSKKAEWIPYHTVYSTLLLAIESPKVARANLEKQLLELIK
mgnify:FL=1